jgi:CRP/FNR family transcriptional regulator, cyclic AMP receptor protein
MKATRETTSSNEGRAHRAGEFLNRLSPVALQDLKSMAFATAHSPGTLLFQEKDVSTAVYIVLSGDVKLSINSSDGRRLIVSIVRTGQVLGLSSAFQVYRMR